MSPLQMLVAVLAVIGAFFYGEHKGARDEGTRWEAKTQKDRAEASEKARKQEAMWQEVVDGTVRNYEAKVAGIRRNLFIALDGLRDRPSRAPGGAPANAGPACPCATGAQLCREDAAFLAREAARSEEQREGLGAAYGLIDGVRR